MRVGVLPIREMDGRMWVDVGSADEWGFKEEDREHKTMYVNATMIMDMLQQANLKNSEGSYTIGTFGEGNKGRRNV